MERSALRYRRRTMISYRVEIDAPGAPRQSHHYAVTLSVSEPAAQQRVSLPAWIPGSYLVREFARHLSALSATQGGRPVPLHQLDKATWEVQCVIDAGTPLELRYQVYAGDSSVRAAFLDAQRGFFNGTSLCLRVEGREHEPHQLQLPALPVGWSAHTAMRAVAVDDRGIGRYEAADYDELVDHPFELGTPWRGRFESHGIAHEFVVSGALPDFDGERLLADTKKISDAEIAFWHADLKAPFQRYVFLLNAVDEGYGGLEHRASTALIAGRRDLPQRGNIDTSDGYVTLLGLISHEYFHSWSVKRMRPAEFARHDYRGENYTQLLWFFEGFTSYFDDLFLVRTGLIDTPRYLKLLAKTASAVLGAPGRRVQSVAQASFDAWVKYYRPDENTGNATISYYAKGALIALTLDLTLRAKACGCLDDVMRALWTHSAGGPVSEAEIVDHVREVAGNDIADDFAGWVHGTEDLPLAPLLAHVGVSWTHHVPTLAQRLGLKVSESALTGVRVSQVARGGVAEQAGFAAGDEVLAVDAWRLRRLDDAARLTTSGVASDWLVARDQRVLKLPMAVPAAAEAATSGAVAIALDASADAQAVAARAAWLGG